MSARLVSYILCGGRGTRLWPLSRPERPKQFLRLSENVSMLSSTATRLRHPSGPRGPVFAIAAATHAKLTASCLDGHDLGGGDILLEEKPQGTALAIAIAACHAMRTRGPGPVLVVPSDHVVHPVEAFWRDVLAAAPAALSGSLVLFGVKPTRPETGYGYIEAAPRGSLRGVSDIVTFCEKPDRRRAREFVKRGLYWNSGMFLFDADAMVDAIETARPELVSFANDALDRSQTRHGATLLAASPDIQAGPASFDRAIVEHIGGATMMPASFAWRDIGTWRSLAAASVSKGYRRPLSPHTRP